MSEEEEVEESDRMDDRSGASSEELSKKEGARICRELQAFAADHMWIEENREALLEQHNDHWIAVKNRKVIATDPELDGLLVKLDDPAHTCIEFITNEPLEMIL